MKKIEIVGEFLFLLLKELSFVQCLTLGALVSGLFYLLGSGSAMLGSSLPIWAMAAGVAGLAVVLLGTIRMGHAKFGVAGVLVVFACMLQLGSANILIPDATQHTQFGRGHLPSLNDLTQTIAWILALGSVLAGISVGAAYVAWSRKRGQARADAH